VDLTPLFWFGFLSKEKSQLLALVVAGG
jgi:hypothetical protein